MSSDSKSTFEEDNTTKIIVAQSVLGGWIFLLITIFWGIVIFIAIKNCLKSKSGYEEISTNDKIVSEGSVDDKSESTTENEDTKPLIN